MTNRRTTPAPDGDLASFATDSFTDHGVTHRMFRKGSGPCVIVISEMPGISPLVLGFADRVVGLGLSVVLPDLFGTAGRDPRTDGKVGAALYAGKSIIGACISKEFSTFAVGKSSPVVDWLRALAAQEHTACGGPGVGVVGMCFTGGFALAMAVDDRVIAPVLSQPSLPLQIGITQSERI